MSENKKQSKIKRGASSQMIFKIIIVGNAGVGKSCLLNRFTKQEFTNDYNATIGVEFQSQLVQIDQNTKIRMQIWDTCGQESFQSIVRSFYRNSTAVFIVYNIADRQSFESIDQWFEEAKNNALENSVFVLVGAQKDRENERQVQYTEAEKFMKEKNMHLFFETSAVDGSNIETSFKEAGRLIFMNYMNTKMNQQQSSVDNKSDSDKNNGSDTGGDSAPSNIKLQKEPVDKKKKNKKECC